jgi:hypothetical protein
MDKEPTRTVFRKFEGEDGDTPELVSLNVIALFPDMSEGRGTIGSYMHIGQHSAASELLLTQLKPAEPDEYADLKAELERLGYRPQVTNWPSAA